MTIEDRLRRAIDARTSSVEPSDDGLERITEKALDQKDGRGDRDDQAGPFDLARNRWFLAAAATVLVGAVVAGLTIGGDGGGDKLDTANSERRDRRTTTTDEPTTTSTTDEPTTSTTTAGSTTTEPTSTSTATTEPSGAGAAIPQDVVGQAIWPRPSSEVRFDDPAAAARSFSLYYVHFAAPVVGGYRAGDSRSGEVPVRPTASGPETTVLVRQLSDGHWYVVGATTANIVVDTPSTGGALACPLRVSGRALAFEGTVDVRIDAYQPDGDRVELGSGFVTGSGSPPAGPFDGAISCRPAGAGGVEERAIVRLSTADQGEATGVPGSAWEATVISLAL
jgi:hypothetical protein